MSGIAPTVITTDGKRAGATEQLAACYDPKRVRVLRLEGRCGKTACQNAAAAAANGEVLVFTDATTRLQSDALKYLVEPFGDESVGCVGGSLVYVAEIDNVTGREGATYWSYELRLRAAESALGSISGFDPLQDQQQAIFPAIDLNLSPNWEFNFGAGIGMTGGTDHLLVKMILGRRFKAKIR